ncbi:MAG TPA: PIG-L family deacetylase, partial [Gemmatimonadaceae bacterium]
MTEPELTRRAFLSQSAAIVGPAAAGLLPLSVARAEPAADKLSVVCVGGHPDDPESGCGGTLARYAAAGHAVTIIYLTRGER